MGVLILPYMSKSQKQWKKIVRNHDRIESVVTWEMACFKEGFAADNEYARDGRQYFESIIKPYTCFVGIYVKLKKAL